MISKALAAVPIENAFLPKNSVFRGAGGTLGNLVSKLLPIIYAVAGALTVVYFVLGAIQYVYSGGDPKAKEAAKNKIQYAVIGFALVALSFLISQFLGQVIPLGPTKRFSVGSVVKECFDYTAVPGGPLIGAKCITCTLPQRPSRTTPGCDDSSNPGNTPNCFGCI